MAIYWPLNRVRGNSVMFSHCLHSDEPIILCDGDNPRMIIMDSRVFAKAYGWKSQQYDMQDIFKAEGMDIFRTATQIEAICDLVSLCQETPKPVIVKKYGWDIMVAMSPAEYRKRQHLF